MILICILPVSYTHLDVYKRQLEWWDQCIADHKAAGMKYIVAPWMDVPLSLIHILLYLQVSYIEEMMKTRKEQFDSTVRNLSLLHFLMFIRDRCTYWLIWV